ncbi:flagellar motor protein MotB [Dokdonia sinensis]|uniref:Flagellar motor protein MotB n=1 Tax=Dokdonia sinensis TaxID=2479847 RepID=A0A3M0GNV7_9FLAO|nr:OmpA family protein [Dokdonia sinensis]RMB63353.1 flagellar motor protein MotB [Dokdonia sinensis]
MSKKSGYLLGMLLTMIICMILAWFFCCGAQEGATAAGTSTQSDTDNRNAVASETTADTATSWGFDLKDPDGSFAINSNDNFNFNTSEFSILQPVSGQVDDGIGKLYAYLNADGNTGKFVDITGYYDSDEENTSALANLGLARANAVKNYFVGKGIPSTRINTYGELNASLVPDGNVYRGPIKYSMTTRTDDAAAQEADALEAIATDIKANPLILYFDTAEASIQLTPEQREKVGAMSRYLDKVEGATVAITGHTDNTGSRTTNTRLGLERANFAKNYLARNGIAPNKINTTSQGPDAPIATNDTEAGRAKNRRCVVTLN